MADRNYYEILGVPDNATTTEVLQAYWHKEDEFRRQNMDASDPRWVEVKTAYETLSNFLKRRDYDDKLMQPSQPPADAPVIASLTPSGSSQSLEDARVSLIDLLGSASSPPVMGSWQDAPQPSASDSYTAPSSTKPSVRDEDPFSDVDKELDELLASAKSASPSTPAKMDDDPFDWLNTPKSASTAKTTSAKSQPTATPKYQVKQSKVQVRVRNNTQQSANPLLFIILGIVVLVGVAGFVVFATIDQNGTVNIANVGNPGPTRTRPPTSTPRATSTPQQMDVIQRLETQGDALFAEGSYSQAVARYTQAISRGASATLYYKRALAFWTGHEFMDDLEVLSALDDLDNAIRWNANYVEAYRLRGIIHYELWNAFGIEENRTQAIADLVTYMGLTAGQPLDEEVTEALTALEVQ